MSFEIKTTDIFERQAKKLARHYVSFKEDYAKLLEELRRDPLTGVDLGGGIRKVRMAITSKGKGKRGGARVITSTADVIVDTKEGCLYLLSIYDKSSQSTITDKEIKRIIKLIQ